MKTKHAKKRRLESDFITKGFYIVPSDRRHVKNPLPHFGLQLTIGNHRVLVVLLQLLLYCFGILPFQKSQEGEDQYRKDGSLYKLVDDSLDSRSGCPWLFSWWNGPVQKLVVKVVPRLTMMNGIYRHRSIKHNNMYKWNRKGGNNDMRWIVFQPRFDSGMTSLDTNLTACSTRPKKANLAVRAKSMSCPTVLPPLTSSTACPAKSAAPNMTLAVTLLTNSGFASSALL